MAKEKIKNKTVYRVWLICSGAYVYIKQHSHKSTISPDELTISSNSILELVHNISQEWSILCDESNLSPLYDYSFNGNQIFGLALNISKEKEVYEIVKSKSGGQFVSYVELDDYLRKYKLPEALKEDLYLLIDALYKAERGPVHKTL